MYDIQVAMRRVGLNSGGYDSFGTYWGIGLPLYRWSTEPSPIMPREESGYVRGATRGDAVEAARAALKVDHPRAQILFYR